MSGNRWSVVEDSREKWSEMDFSLSSALDSLRENNDIRVHPRAPVRPNRGYLFTYPNSVKALLHAATNNQSPDGDSNIHQTTPRSVHTSFSLFHNTIQNPVFSTNPTLECETGRFVQSMRSCSFDTAVEMMKTVSQTHHVQAVNDRAVESSDQEQWKAFLIYRSKSFASEKVPELPRAPTGFFSEAGSFDTIPSPRRINEGLKFHYRGLAGGSRGSGGRGGDSFGVRSLADSAEKGGDFRNGKRNIVHSCCHGVDPTDEEFELQLRYSHSEGSYTRIVNKIRQLTQERYEEIEAEKEKEVKQRLTVSSLGNGVGGDGGGGEESSHPSQSERLNEEFRASTRKRKNNDTFIEPTIVQLWARETPNKRCIRHIRGSSFNPNRGIRKFDHEAYFHEVDIEAHQKKISSAMKELRNFFYYASLGLTHKPLAKQFHQQRDRVFALAQMSFDHSNEVHVTILQEIYRRYTGKFNANVDSRGAHWKELGFRGEDPALELKSGGLLTLLFMLHFHKKDAIAATTVLREAKENGELYPFVAMCVVVTSWVLRMIKKGKLNAIVRDMNVDNEEWIGNKEDRFILICKKLFVGIFYKFHWKVIQGHGDIIDVVEATRQVERDLRRDVEVIVRMADLPDILYLGENLFRRLTPLEQFRQTICLTCTCFHPKYHTSNEE